MTYTRLGPFRLVEFATFCRTGKYCGSELPQAANLLYKIIDARSRPRSTALVTNIDFDAWGDYLGAPPLAMAFLDRIVDGAIILKINGKSYHAHRARQSKSQPAPKS